MGVSQVPQYRLSKTVLTVSHQLILLSLMVASNNFRKLMIAGFSAVLVITCTKLSGQNSDQHQVLFESKNSYPIYEEWVGLDRFVSDHATGKTIFRVVGHADSEGTRTANQRLAESRTQVVVKHLLESGIDPIDIRFSSFGEDLPVNSDLALNRRVEVFAEAKNKTASDEHFQSAEVAARGCLVSPPLPESRLPVELFEFEASRRQEIRVASGTMLLIPASSFVDADGQRVEGKVKLAYEEFHDRAEVFLSGIPMKYDSLGRELPMETYGMFRILVSNHTGQLDLAPSKSIRLEFVSGSSSKDVNFYHLDPRHGRWVDLGKAPLISAVADQSGSGSLSPASQHYINLTSGVMDVSRDSNTLEERFQSDEYVCEKRAAEKLRTLKEGSLREKRAFKKAMKELPAFKLRIEPTKAGEDRNWVKFSLQDVHLNGNRNRAWKTAFKTHVWQYAGNLSRTEFIQKFHHVEFQDLRISLDETKDLVTLELKNLDGVEAIPLLKITKGEKDMKMFTEVFGEMLDEGTKRMLAKRESQFEKRFKTYVSQLNLRERRLSKEADREFALAKARWERDLEWAWEESQTLMTPSELEYSFSDWDEHCAFESKKQRRESEIQFASQATVVRQLSIATCGIYNCDRIKDLVSPVEATANFVANGDVLDWHEAFVFDENLNSFVKYSAEKSESIDLDPEGLLGLIVIDNSGDHYYLQKEDVMAMNHSAKPLRIMNVEPLSSTADVNDIRQLLSMGF